MTEEKDEWVPVQQESASLHPPNDAGEDEWVPIVEDVDNWQPVPEEMPNFAAGNIAHPLVQAFMRGAAESWPSKEDLDLSPETTQWAAKVGLFESGPKYTNPFKMANEFTARVIARAAKTVWAGGGSLFAGTQAALAEAGGFVSPRLGRELGAMPEAFFGSPHPLGIPHLAEPKPFVKPVNIKPIEGSPFPDLPRSRAALTGDPLIDATLQHLQQIIDNPVVDDSHIIPNSWGASEPTENPVVYRDREFPKTMTVDGVTFDTAEPAAVRENVEKFWFDHLVSGGMARVSALKVAAWDAGEVAEDAFYRSHGMDPSHVEEQYTEHLNRIASRKLPVEAPIARFRRDAAAIEASLPEVDNGNTRLWRGNRKDEIGKGTRFTNDLPGIALPFREGYKGGLSYIDVPTKDLQKYLDKGVAAEGAEFTLPKDLAAKAVKVENLQLEASIPDDLFRGTYPDSNPRKAAPGPIDKPTLEESARGREIMEDYFAAEARRPEITLSQVTTTEGGSNLWEAKDTTGNVIASAYITIDGDTARVDNIFAGRNPSLREGAERDELIRQQRGALGPSIVRELLRQFKERNPQINKITGERISGARVGGGYEGYGPEVSVSLPQQARDLGVIGPEKPSINEGSPEEAAKNAIPPAEGLPKAKPSEDGWWKRFFKFTGKLDQPPDIIKSIRLSAEQNEGFMPARTGEIPLQHVGALADAAGIDASEISVGGARGIGRLLRNDAEVRTAMQMMIAATDNVKSLAKDVIADASDGNLIKFQEAIMRRDLAVEQIVGLRAEWGRTGNVFQEFLRDVKDGEALDSFLKERCPL